MTTLDVETAEAVVRERRRKLAASRQRHHAAAGSGLEPAAAASVELDEAILRSVLADLAEARARETGAVDLDLVADSLGWPRPGCFCPDDHAGVCPCWTERAVVGFDGEEFFLDTTLGGGRWHRRSTREVVDHLSRRLSDILRPPPERVRVEERDWDGSDYGRPEGTTVDPATGLLWGETPVPHAFRRSTRW